jgi:hypothetical protein
LLVIVIDLASGDVLQLMAPGWQTRWLVDFDHVVM